jgi:hypothetical protein
MLLKFCVDFINICAENGTIFCEWYLANIEKYCSKQLILCFDLHNFDTHICLSRSTRSMHQNINSSNSISKIIVKKSILRNLCEKVGGKFKVIKFPYFYRNSINTLFCNKLCIILSK